MLPCSMGSRAQHPRANRFKELAIEQRSVPRGGQGRAKKEKQPERRKKELGKVWKEGKKKGTG